MQMTRAARLASWAVRAYQSCGTGRGPVCRFAPSCSNYALEALGRHGALRGLRLTAGRLLRCHPWSQMRCDPVPRPVRPEVAVVSSAHGVPRIEDRDV